MNSKTVLSLFFAVVAFLLAPALILTGVVPIDDSMGSLTARIVLLVFLILGSTGIMVITRSWSKRMGYSATLGLYQWLMSTPVGKIGEGNVSTRVRCVVPRRVNVGKSLTHKSWGKLPPQAYRKASVKDSTVTGMHYAGDRDLRTPPEIEVQDFNFDNVRFSRWSIVAASGTVSFQDCIVEDGGKLVVDTTGGADHIFINSTRPVDPDNSHLMVLLHHHGSLSAWDSEVSQLSIKCANDDGKWGALGIAVLHSTRCERLDIEDDSTQDEPFRISLQGDTQIAVANIWLSSLRLEVLDESEVGTIRIAGGNWEDFPSAIDPDALVGAYIADNIDTLSAAERGLRTPAVLIDNTSVRFGSEYVKTGEGIVYLDTKTSEGLAHALSWAMSEGRGDLMLASDNASARGFLMNADFARGDETTLSTALMMFPNKET